MLDTDLQDLMAGFLRQEGIPDKLIEHQQLKNPNPPFISCLFAIGTAAAFSKAGAMELSCRSSDSLQLDRGRLHLPGTGFTYPTQQPLGQDTDNCR